MNIQCRLFFQNAGRSSGASLGTARLCGPKNVTRRRRYLSHSFVLGLMKAMKVFVDGSRKLKLSVVEHEIDGCDEKK